MDIKEGCHNPYVTCPYNKAHEVPKLRLQRHLLKCRKQYSYGMKACPYNATHIMPEPELKLHFECCADRNLIEGQKYNLNTAHGELPNPTFHPSVPIEDWGETEQDEDHAELYNNHRSSGLRSNHHGSGLRNNHHSSGLRNNHDGSRQENNDQQIRPVQSEDEEGPFSQVPNSSTPNLSFGGLGRGRINQLVAEIKSGKLL